MLLFPVLLQKCSWNTASGRVPRVKQVVRSSWGEPEQLRKTGELARLGVQKGIRKY